MHSCFAGLVAAFARNETKGTHEAADSCCISASKMSVSTEGEVPYAGGGNYHTLLDTQYKVVG
jgi:hypothetical protein